MERRQLKSGEIRCPYCRHVQNKLIPLIASVDKVHGVNYINENLHIKDYTYTYNTIVGICSFESLDASGNVCGCKNINVINVDILGKNFCYQHKYMALHDYLTAKKIKEKEEKKAAADLVKQEKKAAAELAKQEKKAAADLAKQEKKAATELAKQEKKAAAELAKQVKQEKKIAMEKAKKEKKMSTMTTNIIV